MYSNVVLRIFNNPANAGRISKPDGIADTYNEDQTAHIEFSLRVESGILIDCKFRAQANPYIIAICSTITNMVKGKMMSMLFLDPYSIKEQLGDHADTNIMFCIDCFKMAVEDYKEKLEKQGKTNNKSEDAETSEVLPEELLEEAFELTETVVQAEDDDELTDEDFGFFDESDFIEED